MEKKAALIIGASRGLGLAMVKEFQSRGWSVTGTVRQKSGTELHDLAQKSSGRVQVEMLDTTLSEEIESLKDRLKGRKFDLLFVNAGVSNDPHETAADVSTDEFVRVMLTNTLAPMKVVEALHPLVADQGTIGVMSSGLGSVADNERGGFEIYRGSKAALNTLMRSFAVRHANDSRALLLIAPGWIRTDMGGPGGTYSIEEAIPRVVETIVAQTGKTGLQYLDQFGKTVRW